MWPGHALCAFAANYARVNGMAHPKAVYIRESAIVPKLDEWLCPPIRHHEKTCETLSMAGPIDESAAGRQEATRRKIADCDSRLAKYRAALDADADPMVVSAWMLEVQGDRLATEAELGRSVPGESMTKDQSASSSVPCRTSPSSSRRPTRS